MTFVCLFINFSFFFAKNNSIRKQISRIIMRYSIIAILCLLFQISWGQKTDPVLFTVDDQDVYVSEFKQIYEKTNGDEADYSKKSLEEYLDLYINFKLKVRKAHDMGLHEDKELIRELKGYRDQLASNYLTDKEIKDGLIEEVYERQKLDREVRHILFPINAASTPSDTLKTYRRAMSVYDMAKQSKDFAELAKTHSGDKSSVNQGGYLGFITSMLPNGFYEIENAIYNTPVGQVSAPVRSKAGYHIIKVESERPARGQMEIAHIMVMKRDNSEEAKKKIDDIFLQLKQGKQFEILCKDKSEDKKTSKKGGYIGSIKIGQYEEDFETAAFELANDGDYSKPVETSVGWHIIKRLDKKEPGSYKDQYRYLESQIMRDGRFGRAEEALVKRVRKGNKIKVEKAEFNNWVETALDSTLTTYRWAAPKERPETTLLNFNDGQATYSIKDYILYLMKSARIRVEMGRTMSYDKVVHELLDGFIDEMCLKYEESKLEEKYPDFARLMQEYEEGILLFEATKENVWDKASKDTVGVNKFYAENKNDYQWEERANVTKYTVYSGDIAKVRELVERAKTDNLTQLQMRYNQENKVMVVGTESKYEKNRIDDLPNMKWASGEVSDPKRQDSNTFMFYKIEDILPAANKSLEESRGYVVADYQDQLEKEWIKELRDEYPVKVNSKAFSKLIRK